MLVYQSHVLRGSAPGGLLKHLSDCLLQPLDIRHRAENDPSQKVKSCQILNSPLHSQSSMGYSHRNPSLPDLNRSPSGPPSSSVSQFVPPNSDASRIGRYHPYLTSTTPLESNSASGSLAVPFQVPQGRSSSPQVVPVFNLNPHLSASASFAGERATSFTISRVSSTDSITPSESASRSSSHSGIRRRSSVRHRASDNLAIVPWDNSTRQRFEQYIIRLTASAGFSLSWMENNVWHSFLEEFLPSAPNISRKVLTKRILPEAVKEVQEKVKKHVAGKEVTMQGDGWGSTTNTS